MNYEYYLKLQNQYIKKNSPEAYVTAFLTAIMSTERLLFTKYIPQEINGRTASASEYDFASIRGPSNISIIVEVKRPRNNIDSLKNTLINQAYEYAKIDPGFKKGLIIVTNGFSCCYSYIFTPTSRQALKISEQHINSFHINTQSDLKVFVKLLK